MKNKLEAILTSIHMRKTRCPEKYKLLHHAVLCINNLFLLKSLDSTKLDLWHLRSVDFKYSSLLPWSRFPSS
jgi:hypothetical protein